jgi:hypothetical protein
MSSAPAAVSPVLAPLSGKAIASLVLGVTGLSIWPLGLLLGPIGMFFALAGMRESRYAKARSGHGMAVAGMVTSLVSLLLSAMFVALIAWVVSDGRKTQREAHTREKFAESFYHRAPPPTIHPVSADSISMDCKQPSSRDALQVPAALLTDLYRDFRLIETSLTHYYRLNEDSFGPGGPCLGADWLDDAEPGADHPRVTESLGIWNLLGKERTLRPIQEYRIEASDHQARCVHSPTGITLHVEFGVAGDRTSRVTPH